MNDNEYLRLSIVKDYEIKRKELDTVIENGKMLFLTEYRKRYPYHFISHNCIKKFWDELSHLSLLPNKNEYISLYEKNEFFEISVSIFFENERSPMLLQFPYPINIHKVAEYIRENNISSTALNVTTLQKMINEECIDEFDMHMQAKREGRDLLDKIKAENPIIVLQRGGIISDFYLINGTHRVIQSIKDGQKTIEGYIVGPEICRVCGISKNYEFFYSMMEKMYERVYGVAKET